MRQRRYRIAWLLFILLTVLILGSAWLYTNWRSSQTMLPPGLIINGLPMGGMTREQALEAIDQAYTRPITVYYASKLTPLLLPEMVELSVDLETTTQNLDAVLGTRGSIQGFITYLADRLLQREPETQEVVAVVNYSRERVDAFLARTAQKYDQPPQKPVLLSEAGTFRPPQDGTTLDIDASLPPLIKAILAAAPQDREVHLVVDIEPAPEASSDILREALNAALADFTGVAGIFAKDLRRGREFCYNCDVAFSGAGTLKIAIALETYATLDAAPNTEMTRQLNTLFAEGDNTAANQLITQIGSGDAYSGALRVTDMLWGLGLQNTFIAVPYDVSETSIPPEIADLATSRTALNTDPDPARQTTPIDMGLLMEGLYYGAQDGGFLRAVYPQKITAAECQDILTGLTQYTINPLLAAGMPVGTRVAHKHGWAGAAHADVALVYGPQADFVLTAFLYQPAWLVWDESAPTFATIGQLVYRFYNGDE
ncbi:MAG: serine hydrolase [Anaerolineae bacterium]